MRFLLRTLSWSYVRRHLAKTLLTLLGVVVGVATFTAIRSARTSLIQGLRGTVDRMAGKAHLQIASDADVPEELSERLHELEGVRAYAPVIEQLVVAEDARLGTVLVLGVDLLGDREMREYGFEGEDADLDDPLLFLAQPDSIALSKSLAGKAGLRTGDRFRFRAPEGPKEVVVRGLLETKGFAEAFGGSLAVMDVYAAQTIFGRGRRFDRIELRLDEGVSLDAGRAIVERAVGPGFRVETPERRGARMESLVSGFTAGFSISSVFALGIGTFLIFNAFTVAVNRRRRDVGTLRALGATPRQVQALFLLEAAAVGLAGGLAGLAVGAMLADASLRAMGETADKIYGLADASEASLDARVVAEALVLGLVASLVGAWLPARAAAEVRPTEAFAKGAFSARSGPPSRARVAAGVVAFASAAMVDAADALPGKSQFAVPFLLGILGAVLLVGPAARLLVGLAGPLLARLAPASGRLAADALAGNPKRTSGTVLAITLSLAFVLGTGAYLGSMTASITRWMDDQLTSDLYVRASASFTRPDYRYPGSLRGELLALPGVRQVESFRQLRTPFRDDQITLMTIEIEPLLARTRHDFVEGDLGGMLQGLVREGKVAVSDNLARRFAVGKGDRVELATPEGPREFEVAAVVSDFTSDRGSVWMDRALFLSVWGDDRVDTYDVSVAEGADPLAVRESIRGLLAGRMPALISTRAEFVAEIRKAVDAFYVLMKVTLALALLVAFLGIVSSLLISVAERTREIGILKALGAVGSQIRRAVVLEALAVAFVSLALAIPLGAVDARFLETTVAEVYSGWRIRHETTWTTLLQVLVALPVVSALAGWFPARSAARTKVTEAIEYE